LDAPREVACAGDRALGNFVGYADVDQDALVAGGEFDDADLGFGDELLEAGGRLLLVLLNAR
jgi:hypothetical protein